MNTSITAETVATLPANSDFLGTWNMPSGAHVDLYAADSTSAYSFIVDSFLTTKDGVLTAYMNTDEGDAQFKAFSDMFDSMGEFAAAAGH